MGTFHGDIFSAYQGALWFGGSDQLWVSRLEVGGMLLVYPCERGWNVLKLTLGNYGQQLRRMADWDKINFLLLTRIEY